MRRYGKIADDKIVYKYEKTKQLNDELNNLVVINPRHEEFIRAGYIELIEIGKPTDSEYYYSSWEIVDGEITCVWHEYELDLEIEV